MIILDTINKSLEVDLAGAVSANELVWAVHYVEIKTETQDVSAVTEVDGVTTGATAVTMVTAPLLGRVRQIKSLTVYNKDTASATVTIQINNNGTVRELTKVILATNETLQYVD